jgi:2-polyprenyl-6-methoxyphenol hydroxylase-like FAD-dependent oxidoreductase
LAEHNDKGETMRTMDLEESSKMWQHPWQLVRRIRLHETLKNFVTTEKGPGKPAVLHTSSRVVEVDPATATIVLENGSKIQADLVLGADGIYSKTRTIVSGHPSKLFPSGKAAFRFLIPRKEAEADPITAPLVAKSNELALWYGSDRRVVMYPCNDNFLLNFVCIHPEAESHGSGDEWNKQASLDQLLKVYQDFDPAVVKLVGKADPQSLKVWKLLDMEILPTWIKERLALLGDAAHPFLPHQGQGGGVAIEDAATLSVLLARGTSPDDIPERLELYEKIRYKRANAIQEFSRQAGRDWVDGKAQIDMMAYTIYNFGHDEIDNSTNAFKKWKQAKRPDMYWRMPIAFGPAPGPRQDVFGRPRVSNHQTFTTASIKFKTSGTFLSSLFPTESFTFKSLGTVAYASFSVTTLGKMSWLGGGGYNHFGLYIHGVQYKKRDGSTIDGTYMPLLFESLADPIVSGRDELGMPKIYCAIDIHRREKSYRMQASWQNAKFADFNLENLQVVDPKSEQGTIGGESDYGILVYKYNPAVGERGKADCEYPVVVPHAEEAKVVPSHVQSVARSQKASVKFDAMDWEALPTMHHVVSTLAEIPIYEVVGAKVVEGLGVPDVSSARRIE